MTAALALIKRAMSEIGVLGAGATLDAGDEMLVFDALNSIVGTWNTSSLFSYATKDATVTLNPGDSSVTIGPGRDIDVVTPSVIGSGAFIRVGDTDYPIEVVNQTTYSSIWNKAIGSTYPRYVYYDRAGTLLLWPVNGSVGELHIPLQGRLTEFADTTTDYVLADGYERALALTLAEDIADMFQRPLTVSLAKRASAARRAIRRVNAVIPRLSTGLCGGASGMVFGNGLIDGGSDSAISVGGDDYLIYT